MFEHLHAGHYIVVLRVLLRMIFNG
ncbi:hypothetical protein YPPY32_1704, partial [Yersinia pestis PY-32]